MKHTAEQLIVGKAMTGKNLRDALIGVENIAADMGKAHLIDKFQESDPHTFSEKSAEKNRKETRKKEKFPHSLPG